MFLLRKMVLDESITLPFTATQTLVSLELHWGFFSYNELWWLEDEDISFPVKDSAWVLLLDYLLLFFFILKTLKGIKCKNLEGYCSHYLEFTWQTLYGLDDVIFFLKFLKTRLLAATMLLDLYLVT